MRGNGNKKKESAAPIYLDHSAKTQPSSGVVEAMREALETWWANPSSVHRAGQDVRYQVELARERIAQLINCQPSELVFTSGGTESTNLAILGTLARYRADSPRRIIITSEIEHSAVREPIESAEKTGRCEIVTVPVDSDGVVIENAFIEAVQRHAGSIALISIQWANNETGVIQPIEQLARLAKELDGRVPVHTDAIQWVGKMPTSMRESQIDLLSFAGHKFHGPAGAGGLYVRRGLRIAPLLHGGPHERERRGGTENVPAIIGLAVAADEARRQIESGEAAMAVGNLRDTFEREVCNRIDIASINAAHPPHGRIHSISSVAFERLEAEAILISLSERGVYASAGAACSSGSLEPSPILRAMGVPEEKAHGTIRFSFDTSNTHDEVDRAIETLESVVDRLTM